MAVAVRSSVDGRAVAGAAETGRPNVLVVGTFLAVVAGVMLFGGLLGGYAAARDGVRAAGEAWPPEDLSLPNVALIMTYLTLAMSSVTAQWAVAAIRLDARAQMYVAIGLTLLLGLAFVNALWFCYDQLGLAAGENAYATTVYAVTVTHLVVVVAAHVLWLVMAFRAFGGQFSARNAEFVISAATVWHFATATGAVIWFALWAFEGAPN